MQKGSMKNDHDEHKKESRSTTRLGCSFASLCIAVPAVAKVLYQEGWSGVILLLIISPMVLLIGYCLFAMCGAFDD